VVAAMRNVTDLHLSRNYFNHRFDTLFI